jgi:hypothetical protein
MKGIKIAGNKNDFVFRSHVKNANTAAIVDPITPFQGSVDGPRPATGPATLLYLLHVSAIPSHENASAVNGARRWRLAPVGRP